MSCLRTIAATEAGHPEWLDLPASAKEAKARGETQYFTGKPCSKGHVAPREVSGRHCIECDRAYQKTHAYRDYRRGYQKTPAMREYSRAHDKTPAYRIYNRAFQAHRRALQLKATPRWLTDTDKAAMRLIYQESARLTIETGIPHHVDHVVPLKSRCPITRKRNATGFHCPQNLQVIPATDNLSKNCYYGEWS